MASKSLPIFAALLLLQAVSRISARGIPTPMATGTAAPTGEINGISIFATAVAEEDRMTTPSARMYDEEPSVRAENIYTGPTQNLLEQLLEGYSMDLRPGIGGPPVDIDVGFAVQSIDQVSEINMEYTMTMMLSQSWIDPRLAFNSSSVSEIPLAGATAEKIWIPDTFILNDKKSFKHTVTAHNRLLRLSSDGKVLYNVRITTTAECKMRLKKFPLDTQTCTLELGSYGYANRDVAYHWRTDQEPVRGMTDVELAKYSIVRFDTLTGNVTRDTGDYSSLRMTFKMERNFIYFMIRTFFPCVLVVVLSWVSFFVHHDAVPARVGLGITTVLTMQTLMSGVNASLPQNAEIKAIDVYLLGCYVFVFGALLEYALAHNLYRGTKAAALKAATAPVAPEGGGKHGKKKGKGSSCSENGAASGQSQAAAAAVLAKLSTGNSSVAECHPVFRAIFDDATDVDRHARWLFPVAFALLNVVYYVVYYYLPENDIASLFTQY
ncbi:gamma-aminobutyric acid receptor subunit beta-2-like [Branchiostoma floridae]|uniref:Gamma-aminobutyric acid receptor subunit beta n=1 Tax=Branchiostoma floridae TaxID=7739 RepID=A0A9J7L2C4_BRAFL|nr:gamma-aminobutyric acid receptor subunit beta-2-like [Branchiostoma floridae]